MCVCESSFARKQSARKPAEIKKEVVSGDFAYYRYALTPCFLYDTLFIIK